MATIGAIPVPAGAVSMLLKRVHTADCSRFPGPHAHLHAAVGSASLPWSHHRPPASALIGSRLGTARPSQVQPVQADVASAPAAAADGGILVPAVGMEGVQGVFQLEEAAPSSGMEAGPAPAAEGIGGGGSASRLPAGPAAAGVRRQHLMHPGYFTAADGPSYTPAPPEALIDARKPCWSQLHGAACALAAALLADIAGGNFWGGAGPPVLASVQQ